MLNAETMNIQVKTAVASHLSDAQELIALGYTKQAILEINYAKAFLFKHPNTTEEVDEDERDAICNMVNDRFK